MGIFAGTVIWNTVSPVYLLNIYCVSSTVCSTGIIVTDQMWPSRQGQQGPKEDRYKCESITAASTAQQNMRTQRREGGPETLLRRSKISSKV